MDLDSRDETPGTRGAELPLVRPSVDEPITLSPLAILPTGALVDELKRRFEGVVVLTLMSNAHDERLDMSWRGGRYLCMGMCRAAEGMLAEAPETRDVSGSGHAWGADGDSL